MSNYAVAPATPSAELNVMPAMYVSDRKDLDTPMQESKIGASFDSEDSKLSDDALVQDEARKENVAKYEVNAPRIDFKNGAGSFLVSLARRTRYTFTPRMLLCIVAGQILSLCITCTSVVTTELAIHNWSLPASQTWFVYMALMSIYTPITIYKYGFGAWCKMLKVDGWKYAILGTIDVFGNFTTVFGFRYTNLLSCLLLGAWSTPVSMAVTFVLLKARYNLVQVIGVLICIGGLGILITSDIKTGKDWGYTDKAKGDGFMILGATLYGLSNGIEEYLVRGRPLYEVVGMIGFVGFIVNSILVGAYEHASISEANWDGATVGFLFAYIGAMIILYTIAPLLFRFASAPFYNISLLTSDFYSLCFGLFLYHYHVYFLYFIAYPLVLIGLLVFFLGKAPEGHAAINVQARGKQAEKEQRTGKSRVIGDPKGGMGSIL